jgi:hypothetical protein
MSATAKAAARLNQVADRADVMRSHLTQLTKIRTTTAVQASQARHREVQLRTATTRLQMRQAQLHHTRQAMQDQEQRSEQFTQFATDVQEQLQQISGDRSVMAETLKQQLSDFYTELKRSVWGGLNDEISVVTEPKTEVTPSSPEIIAVSPSIANVASNINTSRRKASRSKPKSFATKAIEAPPITAPQKSIEKAPEKMPEVVVTRVNEVLPDVNVKSVNKVEQFIHDYVANLSDGKTLLQVISDRDTVRDLLAQGANQLKVDPSDILNALLQMAEGIASNA